MRVEAARPGTLRLEVRDAGAAGIGSAGVLWGRLVRSSDRARRLRQHAFDFRRLTLAGATGTSYRG